MPDNIFNTPKYFLLILLVLIIQVTFLPAFTISGHVTDLVSEENLAGVNVIIISDEYAICDTVTTNYLGNWDYTSSSSGLTGHPALPRDFAVHQNYPNPFNPSTRIEFGIAAAGEVEIAVCNILGQVLASK